MIEAAATGADRDVSVVIPARNAASTIGATLASLASDTDLILEIIVVDDGSTDDTAAAVTRRAEDHGLPVELTHVSLGDAGAARNVGLDLARGRFVYFIDADDLHLEGGLRALRQSLLDTPRAGVAVGAFVRVVDDGKVRNKRPARLGAGRLRNARALLADRVSIATGSVLLRADAVGETRFAVDLPFDEDTLFWAELLCRTDAVVTGRQVLTYRVDLARSDTRFLHDARRRFLRWLRAARRLEVLGVGRAAIARRAAIIAFKIARTQYAHGRGAEAHRFIAVAQRLWGTDAGRLRLMRYRRRIAALNRHTPVGFDGLTSGQDAFALIVSVDPFMAPVSGYDLRNHANAGVLADFGPVVVTSLHPMEGGSTGRHDELIATALSALGEPKAAAVVHRRASIEPRISRLAIARLLTLVRRTRPTAVVVEGIQLWPLLQPLRPHVPKLILDMHNVESDLADDPGRRRRWSIWPDDDASLLRRRERAAARRVDRIWVCSDTDAKRVRAICPDGPPVDVVPNMIPRLDKLPDRLDPPRTRETTNLLFVGHLGYAPNVRAAARLVDRIVPAVRETMPAARLVLAGRAPGSEVRALSTADAVQLVADPPDLAPLYGGADIAVVPLSEGGGTRLKILEAMAVGVPVVATPIAAEGLGLVDGEEILIADTDESIADRIRTLLDDGERYESIRHAAFRRVHASFGRRAVADAMRTALGA